MEVEKMMSTPPSGRNRQSYGVGNWTPDLANSTPASTAGSEYGGIEFTREDIEALLTEKMRCKSKFNYKERFDNMNDYIKRLKLCIKWFLELETEFAYEQEKLRNALELTERRCDEMEGAVKVKEDELNFIILELRESFATVKEQLAKEESEKLAAMDILVKEKEDRINFEKEQASLAEELGKVQGDLAIANQKVASVNDMYKLLQEYNSSMQVYNNKLQADIDMANEAIKRIEKEKETIIENLGNLRGQYTSIQEQLTLSKASHDEAMKQKNALMNEVANVKSELQQVKEDRDQLKLEVKRLAAEIAASKEVADNSNELEAKCLSQDNQIQMLLSELAIAERKLKMSDISAHEARAECEAQKKLISEMQNRLDDAEFKVKEGERLRKAMHNTILELKGNIRVFCRVRPLQSDESSSNQGKVLSFPSSMETQGRAIDFANNGQKHNFTFDKVFTPEASQEEVFVEISQLVQSALDGYKVCIFAYGQTGSGKTHTMMGRPGDQDEKGLIPRSLEQIFQTKQALRSHGWKYEMRVSMLEIYNETIRDLLSTNQDASRAENGSPGKQYAIKHDANGSTHVSDLTIVDVQSTREVSYLLDRAARSRSVGKTQMNEQSSRSHLVFTMRISGVNETTDQHVQGVLNLIDLAGSERLSKSGSTGDRLKETQAINKSLSSLADVIFALAKKEEHAHVPFRNSKLTYLLQPCLGGDSKTLMFVNISPEDSSAGESLCSLRFAARVNACDIGPPRRQSNIRTESGRFSYG